MSSPPAHMFRFVALMKRALAVSDIELARQTFVSMQQALFMMGRTPTDPDARSHIDALGKALDARNVPASQALVLVLNPTVSTVRGETT